MLSVAEREAVIDTFLTLIEGLYAHLPLKRAMYAFDPAQRLRLLRQRAAVVDDAWFFHRELAATLTALRDAHTRYIGPEHVARQAAMLPFLVEAFGAAPRWRYIVSKVASDRSLIGDRHFVPGVELVWWNGVPIDRAVDLYAEHETGGRPDARRARAAETLTVRALQYGPPPDELWVVVGYVDLEGTEREVRVDWRVVKPARARTGGDPRGRGGRAQAVDPAAEMARRVKKLLFAPERWYEDQRAARPRRQRAAPQHDGEWLVTCFPDNVSAKSIDTPSGRFGYLRLWSFDLDDDRAFVDEMVRLLGLLPDDGLVIDLRANPGGLIWAAERLLQLFTPRAVAPTRFSLLATPLTRAVVEAPQNEADLEPWRQSLRVAVATGELYSQAIPITPVEDANDIGQVYGGPVVAVVDANTYSAGDLFAAGFADNELGILVTVGEATGAGGANVWAPHHVEEALAGTPFQLAPLPAGIGYTVSIRRATRSGTADGLAIEDIGVRGHRSYAMTKRDLVDGNADLLAFCGKLLAARPRTVLRVERAEAGNRELHVTTAGLDRLDVFVDERPRNSLALQDGQSTVEIPDGWQSVELAAYAQGQLRQRRRVER